MTAEATAPAAVVPPERARPAVHRVGRVLGAGAVLGLVGQLLFFGVGIGINVPLGLGLALVGGWLTRRPGARLSAADAWLGPAAIVFAAFAAVRADLRQRLDLLRTEPQTNAWQAWNAGRATALDLLRAADERGALIGR